MSRHDDAARSALDGAVDPRAAARAFLAASHGRATLRRRVTALRALGREVGDPYLATLHPVREYPRAPRFRTEREVAAMLDALPAGDPARWCAELAYGCGLTAAEVAALRPGDVDTAGMVLHLPARSVPLTRHALEAMPPGRDWPRSARTVRRLLPVPARELRDCAALHMLHRGADPRAVAAWLGVGVGALLNRLGQAASALRVGGVGMRGQ